MVVNDRFWLQDFDWEEFGVWRGTRLICNRVCLYIQQYDVIMTSNYVIVPDQLCLNVGNNDIILYNSGGGILSGWSKQKKKHWSGGGS